MKNLIQLILALSCAIGRAQEVPELERILFPITVKNLEGAHGTRWTTVAEMHRDPSLVNEYIAPLFDRGCEPPCWDPIHMVPGEVFPLSFIFTEPGKTSGSYLYVAKRSSQDTFFSLQLVQASCRNCPRTELPVVRDRDFVDRKFSILDVPPPTGSQRVALRVYASDPESLGLVRVQIEELRGREEANGVVRDELISDFVLPLVVDQVRPLAGPNVPVRPPTIELFYDQPFPNVSNNLHFEITPVTPGLRLWAFVSVTDNDNQQVRIYSLQ
jgi:hypothetical protein